MPQSRTERLGLEPAAVNDYWGENAGPREAEIEHSKAISLRRIADRLDDIASGTAALCVYTKEG